jgi:hypothetical protein
MSNRPVATCRKGMVDPGALILTVVDLSHVPRFARGERLG